MTTPMPRTNIPAGLHAMTAGELREVIAAAQKELAELMKWKEAVINELIVAHIYGQVHDDSPRKAVHDAITWNCQVALDPAVSSDAQRLRDTYLQRAEAAEQERDSAVSWNHRVSVCEKHTAEIVDGPCVICELEAAERKAEERIILDIEKIDDVEHMPGAYRQPNRSEIVKALKERIARG